MNQRGYVLADEGLIAETDGPVDTGFSTSLLIRTVYEADGTPMPKDVHGYKALDTGEIIWRGTFEDVETWANMRTGIEPFDRHMAYWERRYAARRFARRLGALPSYADLYEAFKRLDEAAREAHEYIDPEESDAEIVADLEEALGHGIDTRERV